MNTPDKNSMEKKSINTRAISTRIIFAVIHEGRSLSDVLREEQKNMTDSRDQAFVQAVCYGVCRWFYRLSAIANKLVAKPLKEKDQDIYILLLVGLYQLSDMRIPEYAALSETVAAANVLKKIWAKNLVNAVLRNYQRRKDELTAMLKENAPAYYAHPKWMLEKIKTDWPENWEAILEANNQYPPFSLRVNQKIQSRESYLTKLPDTITIPETRAGIILEKPTSAAALPGFSAGEVSVQDGAAQLAAEFLMLEKGQRVLDACAAPGGKTTHILELQPDIQELIAIDHDEARLNSIRENLQRLRLSATCLCADAGDLSSWWDGKPFDRILLDAPCSASGVIRRHPDIKLLRRSTDIHKLVEEQTRLLNTIWQTLKPGGMLLYATCSIFREENEQVIKSFLAAHTNAREEKIKTAVGKELSVGRQILPGMHNMDGFYYACLVSS